MLVGMGGQGIGDLPDVTDRVDANAIAEVVRGFFAAFVSGPECGARLNELRGLFLPGALIIRTCGSEPVVYSVDELIASRIELLTTGDLIDFREWELFCRTDIFGDIAQHLCSYAKSWVQDGKQITGRGMESFQLVRTPPGWRISAAAWDDERDGLLLPTHWH
jgi:hypothetical protein